MTTINKESAGFPQLRTQPRQCYLYKGIFTLLSLLIFDFSMLTFICAIL